MQTGLKVAIIGGDERSGSPYPQGVEVRRFGSSRFRGNGGLKRAFAAIAAGGLDVVLLLVRWLGHSAADRVRAACRRCGVPCHIIPGGESSAIRVVRELVEGVR